MHGQQNIAEIYVWVSELKQNCDDKRTNKMYEDSSAKTHEAEQSIRSKHKIKRQQLKCYEIDGVEKAVGGVQR
jgi:hypothetical protein